MECSGAAERHNGQQVGPVTAAAHACSAGPDATVRAADAEVAAACSAASGGRAAAACFATPGSGAWPRSAGSPTTPDASCASAGSGGGQQGRNGSPPWTPESVGEDNEVLCGQLEVGDRLERGRQLCVGDACTLAASVWRRSARWREAELTTHSAAAACSAQSLLAANAALRGELAQARAELARKEELLVEVRTTHGAAP